MKVEKGIKVRAIQHGYIQGRMYEPEEEFIFTGNLQADGSLARWMECLEPEKLKEIQAGMKNRDIPSEGKVSSAEVKPAAKPAAKPKAKSSSKPSAEAPEATLEV